MNGECNLDNDGLQTEPQNIFDNSMHQYLLNTNRDRPSILELSRHQSIDTPKVHHKIFKEQKKLDDFLHLCDSYTDRKMDSAKIHCIQLKDKGRKSVTERIMNIEISQTEDKKKKSQGQQYQEGLDLILRNTVSIIKKRKEKENKDFNFQFIESDYKADKTNLDKKGSINRLITLNKRTSV